MSFDQQRSGKDQINVKDRASETNPQLNLIDFHNDAHHWRQETSRDNGSADKYLPGLSVHDGGDSAQVGPTGTSSAETTIAIGGSNGQTPEGSIIPSATGSQSDEASISNTGQTSAGGSGANPFQNITSSLETDLKNLDTVMNQFTTDLSSADNTLNGTTDSSSPGGAPAFAQQLQSLMNYLGIPSGNNSSPDSTAGVPASNSDTTAPPLATTAGNNGDQLATPLTAVNPGDTTVAANPNVNPGDTQIASLPTVNPAVPTSPGTPDVSPEAPPASTVTANVSPPESVVPTTAPPTSSTGDLTANVNGFFNSAGQSVNLIGIDAGPEDLAATTPAQLSQDFPGLTAIRLDVGATGQQTGLGGVGSGPEDPNIAADIQAYTGAGKVVELEFHNGSVSPSTVDPDGQTTLQTYENWAQQYKNNPLVMLETPNEPSGSAQQVASDQAQYIEAIRAQGFNNPIGIQPVGGYDESNAPLVLQDLQNAGASTANLYVAPHIYYGGTDPNGALQYAQSEISYAQGNGLPAFIDEYGNALDGETLNPQGQTVLTAMQTLDQQGYGTQSQVGSTFWGMYFDHPDGADSAFANPQGTQLTSSGQWLADNTLA